MSIISKYSLFFLISFLSSFFVFAQETAHFFNWKTVDYANYQDNPQSFFDASEFDIETKIPYITKKIELPFHKKVKSLNWEIEKSIKFTDVEKKFFKSQKLYTINYYTTSINDKKYLILRIPSIYKDNKILKILIKPVYQEIIEPVKKVIKNVSQNSVLHSGSWYKFSATKKGIYKITGTQLVDKGIDISQINPDNLKVFGFHDGMLPQLNSDPRPADLPEIAIKVIDGGDNSFDANDYLLFYSNGLNQWTFNNTDSNYYFNKNLYSKEAYFFLNFDTGSGKRIPLVNSTNNSLKTFKYDYLWAHENDIYNLKSTGATWYGERYNLKETYNFKVNNYNRDINEPVRLRIKAIGNSTSSSSLQFIIDGSTVLQKSFSTNHSDALAGSRIILKDKFTNNLNKLSFDIKYNKKGNSSADAYLDNIVLDFREYLNYQNTALFIQDRKTLGIGQDVNFVFNNTSNNFKVWNITDQLNIKEHSVINKEFSSSTTTLQNFIVFSDNNYLSVDNFKTIPNQNLHSIAEKDYLIIYHPNFKEEAEKLKTHREETNNYKVSCVNIFDIYNEFSSGSADITGIRDFIRNIYLNSKNTATPLKHVLLFGDATYDYKNYEGKGKNFIPTWESDYSLSISSSVATDDFYVLLSDEDGKYVNHSGYYVDVSIGRLVVNTKEEAQNVLAKIIHYDSFNQNGVWQNTVTMVADDVDQGEAWERALAYQANIEIDKFSDKNPNYEIKKIYSDAYKQVNSVGGQRYPGVEEDINKTIENGSLIVHYYGHGGEKGWASERILNNDDILGFENLDRLAFFITTTCEFTRYDDVNRISAGEHVLLNKKGAGIGLLTSTRTLLVPDAQSMSNAFYKVLDEEKNKHKITLGEIFLKVKQKLNDSNKRRLILVGDPGTILKKPEHKAILKTINGVDATLFTDTLKALSKITITGAIEDNTGLLVNKNGEANIKIFDKKQEEETLNNDGVTNFNGQLLDPIKFKSQNNIIFKGDVDIENGNFEVTFIVPKDIKLDVGLGKILLYAKGDDYDAWGSKGDIEIGDVNPVLEEDNEGPIIQLFVNDTTFVDESIVPKESSLYAIIEDKHGINTVGSGVGHDMKAILDENSSNPIVLNNFFKFFKGNYQKGDVRYPLSTLEIGEHTLSLKAWDTYNNSTTQEISFMVVEDIETIIESLSNYPNPFSGSTTFQFQHNLYDKDINIKIEIYNINGQKIKTIEQNIESAPSIVDGITWDSSDGNMRVGSGTYFYRVILENIQTGKKSIQTEKMVIIK